MKLKFLGAAKTVTGSFFVIEANGTTLGVDCGMFQGNREIRERNYQDIAFTVNLFDGSFFAFTHVQQLQQSVVDKRIAQHRGVEFLLILLEQSIVKVIEHFSTRLRLQQVEVVHKGNLLSCKFGQHR
jgi:hypothetical protein